MLFELGQDLVRVFASQDAFLSAQGQLKHLGLKWVDGRLVEVFSLLHLSALVHDLAQARQALNALLEALAGSGGLRNNSEVHVCHLETRPSALIGRVR
jgi:hypothetical protein